MPDWILAIDYGTTSTAAAMAFDGRVELVEIDGKPRVPSMVFAREDGELVVGEEAENRAGAAPQRLERTPKRRMGDETLLLGDREVRVVDAVGRVLRLLADEAIRRRGGERPAEVVLTCPARWGRDRRAALERAAIAVGLGPLTLVPEPVAAAAHFAGQRLREGELVAVYDFGGGTFDTAVLKRTAAGFQVVGEPGGREDLGGEDFDHALYCDLGAKLPPETWATLRASRERNWSQANRDLRREARLAKEALSRSPDYDVWVSPPVGADLLVTAGELNGLIEPDLEATVEELARTIEAAGVQPEDLAAVYLAGGSSRIPLVGRLVERRLGRVPEYLDDPKSVVALGAARLAAGRRSAPRSVTEPDQPRVKEGLLPGQAPSAIAGLALLLATLLPWYGSGPLHVDAWQAFGLLDLLLFVTGASAIAAVALVVLDLRVELPVPAAPIVASLGALSAALVLYRIVSLPIDGLSVRAGALLGLAAAAGIFEGARRTMLVNGESVGEAFAQLRRVAEERRP